MHRTSGRYLVADFEEARACANKAVELGFDVRPEYLEDLDRACAAGAQG